MRVKRRKPSSKSKYNKNIKRIQKVVKQNPLFIVTLSGLVLVFWLLVASNMPVHQIDHKGLRLLNKYELPIYLVESGNCMQPYDVGDGVITFGPGITYQDSQSGFDDINQIVGSNYSFDNSCVKIRDLKRVQKQKMTYYEQVVDNLQVSCNLKFSQDEFNGLVLLSYNSPSIFNQSVFANALCSSSISYDTYVETANSYYMSLSGYDTSFGSGWYNRIVDSAEVYFFGDYKYQNNVGE